MNKFATIKIWIALGLVALSWFFFPKQTMTANIDADNPNQCSYYISLQTLLTNYPLLSFDRANIELMRNRMMAFQASAASNSHTDKASRYLKQYQAMLTPFNIKAVDEQLPPSIVLAIAQVVYPVIDNYYFDTQVSCVLPMYDWKTVYSRHILNFNLGGLYSGLAIKPYDRILFTNDSGIHLGAFPGFFVNNQTTTLGTQFMTGMPLLTALYVIPRYNFANLGNYHGLVPWCSFYLAYVTDINLRKIMDIAGIDVFTLSDHELEKAQKSGSVKNLPSVSLIGHGTHSRFGQEFSSYRNLNSYGMAYLANEINFVNQAQLNQSEAVIRHYFARPEKHNPVAFDLATRGLYDNLMSLKSKYDVLVEADPAAWTVPEPTRGMATGRVQMKGLVGPRAYFTTSCEQPRCLFVFNTSAAPGWHAIVNGKTQKIVRVNYAFMGVVVPQGESVVWFIYEPWVGLLCSLISLVSVLILVLVTVYPSRESHH